MYHELGIYSDWVAAAGHAKELPVARPGLETQRLVREILNFSPGEEAPKDLRGERKWERDGLECEEVTWSVGYGPRTAAWVLKPAGAREPLPGVLALHDHGDFKFYGKEKIADGPEPPVASMVAHRDWYYGGWAFANELARKGFVVLVHDVFPWGSRKFAWESMPEMVRQAGGALAPSAPSLLGTGEVAVYNVAADLHEHVVEKYCSILGTTFAGVIAYEDRVAAAYLASRPDVISERVGCIGLSGGGCRSALLAATCELVSTAVVVGMMSTYAGLLDRHVSTHTWMFFPAGWARHGDWPDLAACRAPLPLLVQYDLDDELFTVEGMQEAHERLQAHYAGSGAPKAYTGEFYPGRHKFDLEMQESAFAWLKARLGTDAAPSRTGSGSGRS
jgi:dienelactone hydrolase